MASKKPPLNIKSGHLPWGMSKKALQPNSVKGISESKIKAFNVGRMNPLKKQSSYVKKKEENEQKKKMEAKQTAEVFEEFVASFEESDSSSKAFVRGSTSIKPAATGDEAIPNPGVGSVYKPKSKFSHKIEEKHKKSDETLFTPPVPISKKPAKKKGTEKKKSILELFKDELKRSQDMRKERKMLREEGRLHEQAAAKPKQEEPFVVEEYKEMAAKGSFDSGDPMTTNLYVGNINPKMNEENLCQLFGKFGPLASVKVMWPRTEEEKARKKNCGFVAYMRREDAERALDHFKGTSIMDYEIQIGWGKAVRVPPQPVYVAPDEKEDAKAKTLDPPSGLPFNAQPVPKRAKSYGGYGKVPPPSGEEQIEGGDKSEDFDEVLYNAVIRVVIPTDIKLLCLIHRMIEFVIREGPMFEAMIMNKELTNPSFQFLFDNRSPAHVYYRWKLFSILQGDSPETWRVDEFRMFEGGSLWKPPPLKNLRSKMLPPLEDDVIVRRGQLSTRQRDELEDQLRNLSMEREKIKKSMVWCLDHAESAEEIVECMCEALCIKETPLPIKIARLYLVSDILQNCSSAVANSSNFRRGFEGKLQSVIEHFHSVMTTISSRIRAEQFKRRVLTCLRAWDQMSVYHYNVVDKLRLTFIGKTTEEMEKQKAFETVAALIGVGEEQKGEEDVEVQGKPLVADDLDGVPLFDDRPIDFSGGAGLDGVPMESLDGVALQEANLDGEPIEGGDIDGVPMEVGKAPVQPSVVKSKWELVDYDSDDSESEVEKPPVKPEVDERQQLMAEVDERKRKILREVEVKAIELYDALESSGGYSKAEITQRVDKYRDKLMQEAVEPKLSPPHSKKKSRAKSRSPSPSVLDKYRLDGSPSRRQWSRSVSPVDNTSSEHKGSRREGKRSLSPISSATSKSPVGRKQSRSRSPVMRRRSTSRSRRRSRSRSRSPRKKRSRSPARRRSRSPGKRRSRSPAKRSRSPRKRSRSPARRRSRSPVKRRSPSRSRSRSPRKRSKSPRRSRKKSRSPSGKARKSKKRSRSRSKSPHKSKSKKSKH